MDSFVDERDYEILKNDEYTFSVLRRVMGGKCKLLLTDHTKLIICFSDNPFPVWIWSPDDATGSEMENIYQILVDNSLLNGEYRFNLKYNLSEYLIKRAAVDGKKLAISLKMFAYNCEKPVKPIRIADGSIYLCTAQDEEELIDVMDSFHKELGMDIRSRESYRIDAKAFINAGNAYFWKDSQGNNVASCKFIPDGDLACINFVFTRPSFRRKHYAENLVYEVTKIAKDLGYIPALYTDADYVASNACYEKIGYMLKGKLCTLSMIK